MKKMWYITVWSDGNYFDLWYLNHFLFGMLCAGIALLAEFPIALAFIISLALMLVWEFAELRLHPEETLFNKTFDVLLSIAGFFIILTSSQHLPSSANTSVFIALLLTWLFLETVGYYAYFKMHRTKRF